MMAVLLVCLLAALLMGGFAVPPDTEPLRRTLTAGPNTLSLNQSDGHPDPPKKQQPNPFHLVVDGVVFSLQAGWTGGISVVWRNLLPELDKQLNGTANNLTFVQMGVAVEGLSDSVTVLQAANTLFYATGWLQTKVHSALMSLLRVFHGKPTLGEAVGALGDNVVFISSYYNHVPGRCNLLMVHDCIPERTGMAHGPGTEYWARIEGTRQWANSLISVSEATTRDLVELYAVPPSIITTTHNRINPLIRRASPETIADFRRRHGISAQTQYIVLVGQRFVYKNTAIVFEAFSSLPKNIRSSAAIVLVGKQPILSHERRYASKATVYHLGEVSLMEKVAALSGAAALVMISDYEGFGLPIAEANACGTMAIVNNHSALPEVAGPAGIYVDHKDVASVRQGIMLALDRTEQERRRPLCLQQAQKFGGDPAHGWNEMASDILGILSDPSKFRGSECDFLFSK